jgi:hypothetical protein
MKYKSLLKYHSDFNLQLINSIDILYSGEDKFVKNIKTFIPKLDEESDSAYNRRLKSSSYTNHLSNIVSTIKMFLLENKINITCEDGKYEEFGERISNIISSLVSQVLLYGRAFIYLSDDDIGFVKSQYDLDNSDIPDLCILDVKDVINWSFDANNKLDKILIRQVNNLNQDLIGEHDVKFDVFHYFYKDKNGYTCKVFRSKNYKSDENTNKFYKGFLGFNHNPNNDEIDHQIIDSDVQLIKTIKLSELPIIPLIVDNDLAIGKKIIGLLVELIQRKSQLLLAEKRGLCAVPTVYLGPEISENYLGYSDTDKTSIKDAWINKGFVVLNKDDKFEFVEPSGQIFSVSHDMQTDLVSEIYKITFLSALNNTQYNKNQSGLSKEIDLLTLRLIVSQLATIVKCFIDDCYEYLEHTRNAEIEYTINGLDQSSTVDTVESIKTEIDIFNSSGIKSPTFVKLFQAKIASFILKSNVPQDIMSEIVKEIGLNSENENENESESESESENDENAN